MEFLWLVGLFFGVGVPAAAFVALTRTGRLRRDLELLRSRVAALDLEAASLRRELRDAPATSRAPEPPSSQIVAPEPPPAPQPAEPAGSESGPETTPEAVRPAAHGSVPPSPRASGKAGPAAASPGLEERLTSRWLVWLGGATIALGGGFLVKYSIDNELLDPAARVALGLALSLALIAGGEWARRRPLQKALANLQPSYVAPALTAAGLATGFASIYAAYALYDLVAPFAAFVALAALAAAGVALSFFHGPFIAALGFMGGVGAPLLVSTGEPRAELLFPYLLFVVGGTVGVLRYMNWPVVGWLALAGGALWPALWLASLWSAGDGVVLGTYLIAFLALFVFVPWRKGAPGAASDPFGFLKMKQAELQVVAAAAAAELLLFATVRMDHYGSASVVALLLLSALALVAARREPALDALPAIAAAVAVAAVALWHLPQVIPTPGPLVVVEGRGYGREYGPIVPPELREFLAVSAAFGLLFGGVGFAALWGARRPALWAALAAAAPLAILAAAYWRVVDFEVDLAWAAASLAVAGLYVAAAERVARWRDAPDMNEALGAFAAAAVAAVAFAAAASLREAWLTVALALEVAALGWLHRKLDANGLRACAGVLGAIVLVRLAANPFVFDYPLGAAPGFNWLLYGYGVPALAFWLAARLFREGGPGPLPDVLECAALAFATLLVTLEIRSLMQAGGRLDWPGRGLPEASLQTLAWLAIASGLHRADAWASRVVTRWGWRVLGGLAAAQLALVHLLVENPLLEPFNVGSAPVLNWLLVAYGAPAALLIAFAREAGARGERAWARGAFVLALALLFAEVSLEVRRAFHGSPMRGRVTDPEWWAYSAAWLAYAGLLLALAISRVVAALRYASLALVMLTVAKVFLLDMSELTGLWRALSFLGLGLSLVAVGWLYQRFVFPPKATRPAAVS